MKYKALVTAETVSGVLDKFCEQVDFEYAGYCIDHEVMPREELLERVRDIDILICEYDTIDAQVLDAAQRLRLIICCRGGVKTVIDLERAKEKGVVVCNNAGRNAAAVADLTMGFMLDMTRNISLANSLIHNRVITTDVSSKPEEYRDTVWGLDNSSPFIRLRGASLNHMTLGLVGFGHTGRHVARRAKAFGMDIVAYDPWLDEASLPEDLSVSLLPLDELLAQSDIVSLHCAVTPQTKGMFDAARFAQMKNGAYFINTARGELVVESDLIAALDSGKLSGAAIDVTVVEPIASDCPLLDAKNLIITPHIAGSSYDVQATGTAMIAQSLGDWLEGRKPANCVVG